MTFVLPSGPSPSAALGVLQVMLAALLWGTVGVSTQLLAPDRTLPQELLGLARMALGGPAILLVVVLLAKGNLRQMARLHPGWLAAFALGCAVFQVCLFRSFALLGVTVTVFVTVCLPPMIATGLTLLSGRRDANAGVLLSLALAGTGLWLFAADGAGLAGLGAGGGLAVACLASVAFVVMSAAARRLSRDAGPLVVAGAGLSLSAVLLFCLQPLLAAPSGAGQAVADWHVVALVLYLGLGPTACAYVLYCSGMARCRSVNLGLVASMVEPAFAALLAWAFLNEKLTSAGLTGCALVMLAMVVLWAGERRALSPQRSRVPAQAARYDTGNAP